MPAARYWRVVGIAPYTLGGDLELGELQLYGGGARVDAPGMLACSHAPIGGTLAALSDGDPASACRFAGAHVKSGGFGLRWDLGSAQSVDGLRLAGGSARALYLDTLTLQYSADAASWSTLATIGRGQWPGAAQWGMIAGDLFFAANRLLLRYDGSFADASASAYVVTNSGVTIDAGSRFGSGAARFNGSAYLLVNNPPSTGGDFTFETWLRVDALPTVFMGLMGNWDGGSSSTLLYLNVDGSLSWYYSASAYIKSAAIVQAGRWHHVRCVKLQGAPATFMLFVDGVVAAQTTATQGTIGLSGQMLTLGYVDGRTQNMFNGLLDETVVTFAARSWEAFVPSSVPYVPMSGLEARPVAALPTAALQRAAAGSMQPFSVRHSACMRFARDTEFGGPGSYPFKVEGLAGSQQARVTLLRARDRLVARETWSAADGTGEFTGLDVGTRFIALAQDPAGLMHPVGADHYPELPGSTP